jgi:pilus assembly protein CpaE
MSADTNASIAPGTNARATLARAAAPVAKVYVSDPESEGVIRLSLSDLGVDDAEFTNGTAETASAALATQASPRLLVIDLCGVKNPLACIDELATRCEPNVGVVAIGERNDIILYRHLKDAGVAEYFFKPLVLDVVKNTFSDILSGSKIKAHASRTGKLIFVMGVRGGVGATTIAASAAWGMAKTGQRWVMLVDLDLQNGDAALQLDSTPSHALREAFEKPERVDKLFLERGTIHVNKRLDILASMEPLGECSPLNEDAVISLFEKLQQRYHFVFVDLPARAAVGLTRLLRGPSICVLVSNETLTSTRELGRWREWIGPNSPERRTMHVLNMAGASGALSEADFIRISGQAPDVTIAYAQNIAMASNLGIKALQKCESLNTGIRQLLHELAGEPAVAKRSLLSRLFYSK